MLWNSEDKRTRLMFLPSLTKQNLDITVPEQLVRVRIYTFLAIVYFKTALKVNVLFISVKCINKVTTSIQVPLMNNICIVWCFIYTFMVNSVGNYVLEALTYVLEAQTCVRFLNN